MTISAKIIADSISQEGIRLTTLQLRYYRYIHAEVMTHRAFSRNASSSRAIPVKRLIQDIIDDPVYPSYWGANQKGMQAGEEIDNDVLIFDDGMRVFKGAPTKAWDKAREDAIKWAQRFNDAGYHKQIVNRLLEPFSHINVVVTATEWNNFFALRRHKDAQPEIHELADRIYEAREASSPNELHPGEWHLPYIQFEDFLAVGANGKISKEHIEILKKVSAARCARVSYLTHDGKKSTVEEDFQLFDRLLGSAPLHASPAEHQATPDTLEETYIMEPATDGWCKQYRRVIQKWTNPELHGNLRGWCQFRKTLPNENIQ